MWGDDDSDGVSTQSTTTGTNIYIVTSYGYLSTLTTRGLQVEVAPFPPITIPAALYVKDQTDINGSSTFIEGNDVYGSQNKAGIATTLADTKVGSPPKDTVNLSGSPNIMGLPTPTGVVYNSKNLDVQATVNALKAAATDKPTLDSKGALSGANWGTPTGGGRRVLRPGRRLQHRPRVTVI